MSEQNEEQNVDDTAATDVSNTEATGVSNTAAADVSNTAAPAAVLDETELHILSDQILSLTSYNESEQQQLDECVKDTAAVVVGLNEETTELPQPSTTTSMVSTDLQTSNKESEPQHSEHCDSKDDAARSASNFAVVSSIDETELHQQSTTSMMEFSVQILELTSDNKNDHPEKLPGEKVREAAVNVVVPDDGTELPKPSNTSARIVNTDQGKGGTVAKDVRVSISNDDRPQLRSQTTTGDSNNSRSAAYPGNRNCPNNPSSSTASDAPRNGATQTIDSDEISTNINALGVSQVETNNLRLVGPDEIDEGGVRLIAATVVESEEAIEERVRQRILNEAVQAEVVAIGPSESDPQQQADSEVASSPQESHPGEADPAKQAGKEDQDQNEGNGDTVKPPARSLDWKSFRRILLLVIITVAILMIAAVAATVVGMALKPDPPPPRPRPQLPKGMNTTESEAKFGKIYHDDRDDEEGLRIRF